MLALLLFAWMAPIAATNIQVLNLCDGSMQLYIGSHGAPTTIEQGADHSLELADGSNAAYRYGASYQATQAEFANVDSSTWFDISIIPSGGTGPGSCSSLEDCKAVTGGTGFNVAMLIVPSSGGGLSSSDPCRVLSCLDDGCDDAYQFPDQDARTHSCSADVEFQVIFCADNSTQVSSDSAADFWVDANSGEASGSSFNSSGDGSDGSDQSPDNAQVEPQSDSTSAPSSSQDKKTTSNGSADSSSSTSTVLYAAVGVAVGVVAIAAVAVVFKRRHAITFWWETRRFKDEDRSSDELGFVRVSDAAVI
ncbi:Thaumatin-like protein [Phytophthora ramorum]|uniref:Thaumatin-like protein n=1 Tax=Phytophthora ramorum TaxID=164328 RepID=UPI0030B31A0C|nr:Thaumatin-like protein [Phytophthora ramorum]